jgi:hypothetical protein
MELDVLEKGRHSKLAFLLLPYLKRLHFMTSDRQRVTGSPFLMSRLARTIRNGTVRRADCAIGVGHTAVLHVGHRGVEGLGPVD